MNYLVQTPRKSIQYKTGDVFTWVKKNKCYSLSRDGFVLTNIREKIFNHCIKSSGNIEVINEAPVTYKAL